MVEGDESEGRAVIRLQDAGAASPSDPASLCVDRAGLATLLDVSVRQIDRLDLGGRLPAPLALGRCKRWSVEEVKAWAAAGAPDRRQWASMRRSEL